MHARLKVSKSRNAVEKLEASGTGNQLVSGTHAKAVRRHELTSESFGSDLRLGTLGVEMCSRGQGGVAYSCRRGQLMHSRLTR